MSLTTNELLTLIVSSLALLISGIALYFQVFYFKRNVTATIFDTTDSLALSGPVNTSLKLAFVNAGTENALISKVTAFVEHDSTDELSVCTGWSSSQRVEGLPLVLKPRDIATVTVPLRIVPWELYGCGKAGISMDGEPLRNVRFGLEFETMTTKGDVLNATHELGTIQVTKTEYRGGMSSTTTVRIQ